MNFEYRAARNILCPEWLFNTVPSRSLDDSVWTHATFKKYWNGVILTSWALQLVNLKHAWPNNHSRTPRYFRTISWIKTLFYCAVQNSKWKVFFISSADYRNSFLSYHCEVGLCEIQHCMNKLVLWKYRFSFSKITWRILRKIGTLSLLVQGLSFIAGCFLAFKCFLALIAMLTC